MKSLADCTECCALYENDIYCVSKRYNIIFKINTINKKTSVVGHIPEEDFFSTRLVGQIEIYRDEMIFVPATAKKVWIWKIKENKLVGIEIEHAKMPGNIKFLSSCLQDDRLFLFGCHYPAIVELIVNEEKLIYHTNILKMIKQKAFSVNDCYFRTNYARVGTKIYLAACADNKILEFDFLTKEGKWYTVGKREDRFSGIAYDGDCFWIAPRISGCAYKWDGKNYISYSINEKDEKKCMAFTGIVVDGENVIIPNLEYDYMFVKTKGSDVFMKMEHTKHDAYKNSGEIMFAITRDAHICIGGKDGDLVISCDADAVCKLMIRMKRTLEFFKEFIENEEMDLKLYINMVTNV